MVSTAAPWALASERDSLAGAGGGQTTTGPFPGGGGTGGGLPDGGGGGTPGWCNLGTPVGGGGGTQSSGGTGGAGSNGGSLGKGGVATCISYDVGPYVYLSGGGGGGYYGGGGVSTAAPGRRVGLCGADCEQCVRAKRRQYRRRRIGAHLLGIQQRRMWTAAAAVVG